LRQPLRGLEVAPGPASSLYQIDVPLAGLAVGDYTVEVSASHGTGNATDALAFRIIR
jgi:hypothetical protein